MCLFVLCAVVLALQGFCLHYEGGFGTFKHPCFLECFWGLIPTQSDVRMSTPAVLWMSCARLLISHPLLWFARNHSFTSTAPMHRAGFCLMSHPAVSSFAQAEPCDFIEMASTPSGILCCNYCGYLTACLLACSSLLGKGILALGATFVPFIVPLWSTVTNLSQFTWDLRGRAGGGGPQSHRGAQCRRTRPPRHRPSR